MWLCLVLVLLCNNSITQPLVTETLSVTIGGGVANGNNSITQPLVTETMFSQNAMFFSPAQQ